MKIYIPTSSLGQVFPRKIYFCFKNVFDLKVWIEDKNNFLTNTLVNPISYFVNLICYVQYFIGEWSFLFYSTNSL